MKGALHMKFSGLRITHFRLMISSFQYIAHFQTFPLAPIQKFQTVAKLVRYLWKVIAPFNNGNQLPH